MRALAVSSSCYYYYYDYYYYYYLGGEQQLLQPLELVDVLPHELPEPLDGDGAPRRAHVEVVAQLQRGVAEGDAEVEGVQEGETE